MDINIRKIDENDYKYINKWWLESDLPIPEFRFLPENGLGGLIVEKEKPIAAVYIYTTNSKLGYIDFLIADPNYREKDRYDIIIELFKTCTQEAFNIGCESVWAQSSIEGVTKRAKEIGWTTWGKPQTIITYKK